MIISTTTEPKYPILDFESWRMYIREARELLIDIYIPFTEVIDEFYRTQEDKIFMKDETIKKLKQNRYHSNRIYHLLQKEALNKIDSEGNQLNWYMVKDMPKQNLISHVNQFNKYRQGMKEYEIMIRDKDTGIVLHEETVTAMDLYQAKDKGRKIVKDRKLVNTVIKCKQINKKAAW